MSHGTLTGYREGCRCPECRAANTAACRRYRALRRFGGDGTEADVDHGLLSDLLHELFPDGLTDECPARRKQAA